MDDDEIIDPIPLRPKAPDSSPAAGADETKITIPSFKPKRGTDGPAELVNEKHETKISEVSLRPAQDETNVEEVFRKPSLEDQLPKTRFDIPQPPKPKPLRWPIYVCLLLTLALVVLWFAYLRERTENRPSALGQDATIPQLAPTLVPLESPEEKRMREAALQKQATYRFAKGEWDYQQAARWSITAYAAATNQAEEAATALSKRVYATASNLYHQAVETLERLEGEKPQAVTNLLARGREAYVENRFEESIRLLELALQLDGDQDFAKRLLVRARVGPRLQELLTRGDAHEQAQNWALAHADYQEAVLLDPESGVAASAFNRVKAQIAESGFQVLMSEGLNAYAAGDYTNALVSLTKAKAYRPESSEVKDALAQVRDAIRKQKLARQQKQAEALEADEQWEDALAIYMKILGKDPQVEFARQGRLRATQQIELINVLRDIVNTPDALLERKGQQHAFRVLSEVKALPYAGKKVVELAAKLQELMDAIRQPIEVTITSDGSTHVSLYKVGRFGPLTAKVVELTPGKYTIVGARAGYRDVRIDFVLKPGSGPRTVDIVCRDKI